MSRANDQAFPIQDSPLQGALEAQHGLSIREHFAAMAMQGFLANSQCKWDWGVIAASAVGQADQLIAALAKPVKP